MFVLKKIQDVCKYLYLIVQGEASCVFIQLTCISIAYIHIYLHKQYTNIWVIPISFYIKDIKQLSCKWNFVGFTFVQI